jgi:hypothetical protein
VCPVDSGTTLVVDHFLDEGGIMGRRILLVVAAIAAAAFQPLAHGMASAQVDFSPNSGLDLSLSTTGHEFLFEGPNSMTLAPGQVIDFSLDYTVTISEDGLPVPPSSDSFCVPLHDGACTPPHTGFEQVFVEFQVWYVDPRAANPFISISGGGPFLHQTPANGTPESFTESGSFHVHVVNMDTVNPQTDTVSNYAVAFVEANPIPEPEIYGLMLMGLGVCGAAARRSKVS